MKVVAEGPIHLIDMTIRQIIYWLIDVVYAIFTLNAKNLSTYLYGVGLMLVGVGLVV